MYQTLPPRAVGDESDGERSRVTPGCKRRSGGRLFIVRLINATRASDRFRTKAAGLGPIVLSLKAQVRSVEFTRMPTHETLCRIKDVIRRSLRIDAMAPMSDDMPLIGGEFELDSLDILLIVTELEKEFGIRVKDAGMSRSVFTNIQTLGEFVEQMRLAA